MVRNMSTSRATPVGPEHPGRLLSTASTPACTHMAVQHVDSFRWILPSWQPRSECLADCSQKANPAPANKTFALISGMPPDSLHGAEAGRQLSLSDCS
jgi:hypothetical protein